MAKNTKCGCLNFIMNNEEDFNIEKIKEVEVMPVHSKLVEPPKDIEPEEPFTEPEPEQEN